MPVTPISVGDAPNDGTGSPVRTAFQLLNTILGLLGIGDAEAVEALAAGDLVNLHEVAGVLSMRKADADDVTKPANAFVREAVAMGDAGQWFGPGLVNNQVAGLTPGKTYYLSTVAGGLTDDVSAYAYPQATQVAGVATAAGALLFAPGPTVEAP